MSWAAGDVINTTARMCRLSESIPSSYTVWIDTSTSPDTIRAESNVAGSTDYLGTNQATVINYVFANLLTPARTWKEKVVLKGNFTSLDSALQLPSYTVLEVHGKLALDDNVNCNVIENENVESAKDEYIEILLAHIDGNKANNSAGCGIKFNTTWYSKITNVTIENAPEEDVLLSGITGTAGCYYNDFHGLTVLSSGGDGIKLTTNGTEQKANENRFYGTVSNSNTGYGVNINKGGGNTFFGLEASGNGAYGIRFNERGNIVHSLRGENNGIGDVLVDAGVDSGSVWVLPIYGDALVTDPNGFCRVFRQVVGIDNIPIGMNEQTISELGDVEADGAQLRIRQVGNYELILDSRRKTTPGNYGIHFRTENAAGTDVMERMSITAYENLATVLFRNCWVYFSQKIEAHTGDGPLWRNERGSLHTNLGASGAVTLTLPQDAEAGDWFEFAVMTAQELRVDAGAAGAIYINGAKQTDDKYIWANDEGESVKLVCDGNGDWIALFTQGTWDVEL